MNYLNSDKLLNTVSNPVWRRFTMTLIGMCVGVGMSFGQTLPTPKPLPFFEDWGTDASIYLDGSTASETILPRGFAAVRNNLTGGTKTLAQAEAQSYNSNGFVDPAGNFGAKTYTGSNVGLFVFRSTSRALGLVLAVNTDKFTNVKVSYDITPTVSASGTYFGAMLQYRIGTTGVFTSLPNSIYETTATGVLGVTENLTVTLPGIVNDQPNVQLRWVFWYSSAGTEIVFDNISVSGTAIALPTETFANPTPKSLPYFQDWGTNGNLFVDGANPSEFILPLGFVGLRGTGSAARNALSAKYAGYSSAFVGGSAVISPATYAGSNVGMELYRSNTRQNGLLLAVSTQSNKDVKLEYTITPTTSAVGSYFGLIAQYRIGTTGFFTDITNSLYESTAAGVNLNTPIAFNLSLPGIVEGNPILQIRWVYWNASAGAGVVLDNISVTGTLLTATKLSIKNTIPTVPIEGFPFSLIVESINNSGDVTTLPSDLTVSLSHNGMGTLSGLSNQVILAGASSTTFTGLTYSPFQNGVTFTAFSVSGFALESGSKVLDINSFSGATFLEVASATPANGTNMVAGRTFSVVVNTKGPNGFGSVLSTTGISLGVSVGTLSGVTSGVFNPGTTSITISGIIASTESTNASLFATVINGDMLTTGTLSGVVIKPRPSVLSLSVITGTGLSKNTPFSIVVSATNVLGEFIPLSSDLLIALSKTSGSGTLNISSATITAGAFAVTVTGVKYSGVESGVSFGVSANGFTSATSTGYTFTGPPLPTETFTKPTPRPLPYFQDFGTNISVWNDVTNASESILPFGLVVARQTSTVFRTFDDADLSNYLATGFVGGASVNPGTYAGGNIGLRMETRENRGEALVLALRSSGYENLKLSYTLVPEVITGAGVYGMVAQSRVGNTGFFTNIIGTEFLSTASGVVLGVPIYYNVTLPGALNGQGEVNLRWIRWHNSVPNSVILDNISISGTKTDYLTISTPINPFVGDVVSVTVNAFDKFNNPKTVSGITIVTITGNSALLGATVATITGGSSSVVVSGLVFGTAKFKAELKASVVSGDAFGEASSSLFNVSGLPTSFKVMEIQPLGNLQVNKPISVKVKLVDANGKTALAKSNVDATLAITGGTGVVTGTVTGTFAALMDSIITIKTFTYDKAESDLKISVNATGFIEALSDTISVKADALAGVTVLYSEDFEKSVRVVGANPAIPAGMTMFNIDGQTASTATYPRYLQEAWVINRIRQEPSFGRGPDIGTTPTFWSNVNSIAPDSNFLAYSASWFNDVTKDADRWLVTPAILMEGNNFKLNFQARSATGSGNFKDRLEVRATQIFNGNSIVIADWDALPVTNLTTGLDSNSHLVSTRVTNFEYKFVDNLVKDLTLYLAFRLVTPADKGDRISIDNIYVTSGGTTGIEAAKVSKLGLYPNPATESISLSFETKTTSPATVSIISATGQVAAKVAIGNLAAGNHNKQIDVSGLPSGFYMVKLQTNSGVFVTKFLKQ